MERDESIWQLHHDGLAPSEIAKRLGITANVGALEKTVDRLVGEVERLGSSEC